MLKIDRFIALPLMASLLPAASGIAWADSTEIFPQNGAGYNSTVIDPNVDFSHGDLSMGGSHASITIGGGTSSQGTVGNLGIDYEKRIVFGSSDAGDTYSGSSVRSYGFMLNPGIHLRVDYLPDPTTPGSTQTLGRVDIEVSGVAAFRLQGTSRDGLTQQVIGVDDASQLMKNGNSSVVQVGEIPCSGANSETLRRTHCLDGLPSDLSMAYWSDEQRADFSHRMVPVYQVQNQPSSAYELVVLQVTGIYQDHPGTQFMQEGARVTAVSLAGETAVDVAGVKLDFNGSVSAGGVIGSINDAGSESRVAADGHAQLGVGVHAGRVGRIGYNVDFDYEEISDGHALTDFSQTLSLSRILGTPLTIGATRETERLDSGSVITNLLNVGGVW